MGKGNKIVRCVPIVNVITTETVRFIWLRQSNIVLSRGGEPPPDYQPSNYPGCQKRLTPSFLIYSLQQMGFLEREIFQTPSMVVSNLNAMIKHYLQSKNPFVVHCQKHECDGFTLLSLEEEKYEKCRECCHRQLFRGRDRMRVIGQENKEAQLVIENSHGKIHPCHFVAN